MPVKKWHRLLHITREVVSITDDPSTAAQMNDAMVIEEVFGVLQVLSSSSAIPAWTAFHCALSKEQVTEKSAIHYLPSTEHPPTETVTVNEILKKSTHLFRHLELDMAMLVFDLANYAKVQEL